MFMITSPRRLALVVVDVSVSPDEDLFGSERNLVPSWRVVPQPRLGAVITGFEWRNNRSKPRCGGDV